MPDRCNRGRLNTGVLIVILQTPRLLILVFLVYQMTLNSLEMTNGNKKNPHADYVKFLPKNHFLPTLYDEAGWSLLKGTSLGEAVEHKLVSLEKEFNRLVEATQAVPWCAKTWFNEDELLVRYDWELADEEYRSRALELPRGIGDAMVPVLDMANHASDNRANARFEVDDDHNVLLVVRDDKSIADGEEITIMYGVGGATEMIFSYGFLEEGACSAREMFLSLSIPDDDPLRFAKIRHAQEAPGVRIFVNDAGQVQWDSNYVWWACVNEEDGLSFRVALTNDGEKELQVSWKDREFSSHELQDILLADELRDIFVLRATVLIQQRVARQGMELASTEEAFIEARDRPDTDEDIWKLVNRLRDLDLELVTQSYEQLETEVRSPRSNLHGLMHS